MRPTRELRAPVGTADRVAARASAKSARRSASSSSPTETRSRPSVIPAAASAAGSSARCDEVGGWTTMVWTLPRLAVRSGMVSASKNVRPAARPPARSTDSIAPPESRMRVATSRCGWLGSPGYVTRPTPSWCSSQAASDAAVAAWRSTRTASVAMPRSTRNAANGPERRARVDLRGADGRDPVRAAHDRAGHHVRVSRQVLGRRFHDQVGAVLQGPAHDGRRERVVHGEQRPVPVCELGQRRKIGQHAGGVRDRLDVQDAGGSGGEGCLDGADIGGVHVCHVHAQSPERRDRLRPRRSVADLADEQPVTGPEQGQEGGVDRGHPRRERDAGLRAVQVRDGVAERHDRRIVDPAVGVARLVAAEHRRQLVGVKRRERRRLVDRDGGRRLAHGRHAGRRADGACRRAGAGSLVGHPADATPGRDRPRPRAPRRALPRLAGRYRVPHW